MVAIVVLIYVGGKKFALASFAGWHVILAGFGLVLFGSVWDLMDNFEQLNRFIIIGDTEIEAILEKIVGYSAGFVLLGIGFWRWLPLVGELRLAERNLHAVNERLEAKVVERQAEFAKAYQGKRAEERREGK